MSKDTQTVTTSGGIGISGFLTIIFVIAKILGLVTWSWWWVLSPLWISALLGISILVVVFGVAALIAVIAALLD